MVNSQTCTFNEKFVARKHSKLTNLFASHLSHDMTNQQNECAPSKDSDQPGHPPSLISLAVHPMASWVPKVSSCGQWRLWSDWEDAQADLSLRWMHSHFVGFVMSQLVYQPLGFAVCIYTGIILQLSIFINEPRHEKICFCHLWTTKSQISLQSDQCLCCSLPR